MEIKTAIALDALPQSDLLELQKLLLKAGFSPGPIDGLFGARTLEAWASFKESVNQHDPDNITKIGPASYGQLLTATKIQEVKHDFSTKGGTIAAIRWECNKFGLYLRAQQAYIIATVQHETAGTFKPLEEYGKGSGRPYGRPDPTTGKAYYGRGFVQLTWKSNYQKYSRILNADLVNHPEKACDPSVALFVLVHGFKTGAFTGRRLEQYICQGKTDFFNARRCINGLDCAVKIASLAQTYL
jgi:predicted chitinase